MIVAAFGNDGLAVGRKVEGVGSGRGKQLVVGGEIGGKQSDEQREEEESRHRLGFLENDVEDDFGVGWLRYGGSAFEEFYGEDEFRIGRDFVFVPVPCRIAFKERVGREVGLRDERLVAGSSDEVVDVLGGTVGVVAGHDGIDVVSTLFACGDLGSIFVTLGVIEAAVIGVPEIDGSARDQLAFGVEDAAGDFEGKAGVARSAENSLIGSTLAEERAQDFGGGRLVRLGFGCLPGQEQLLLREGYGGTAGEEAARDTKLQHLAAIWFGVLSHFGFPIDERIAVWRGTQSGGGDIWDGDDRKRQASLIPLGQE